MIIDKAVGLYVHIPFCVRKCNYCDFASFSPSDEFRERYIDALTLEIKGYKELGLSLDTVFFGGGTPSLLEPQELEKIMQSVHSAFVIKDGAEISAEVNPATLTKEKLKAFICSGFNRFSIGLQSIHKNELKSLGRIHTHQDFLKTYNLLRDGGVNNISVDLMFGIPEQTKESFKDTLEEIIKLSPEHISAYGLILEEGTPFYKVKDSLPLPDEEDEREMYFFASERLSEAGYSHYEISNFAKPSYQCRHNLKYWNLDEYIGVGLAAHSYLNGERFSNSAYADDYFSGIEEPREQHSFEDSAFEYAMLRLRTSAGIPLMEYKKRFGVDFSVGREEKISFYKKHGLILADENRLALTLRGFYVSNSILSDLL